MEMYTGINKWSNLLQRVDADDFLSILNTEPHQENVCFIWQPGNEEAKKYFKNVKPEINANLGETDKLFMYL